MVADGSTIKNRGEKAAVKRVELTPEEEAAELARWASEAARRKARQVEVANTPTLEDRIKALETKSGAT